MEGKLQHQIAFHLTGRPAQSNLQPVNFRYRPALLARYADLTSLRYDFPLVLNRTASPERAVVSLSRLVDEAVGNLPEGVGRDRIARHAHRIEQEIRRKLLKKGAGDFATVWHTTADELAGKGDETIKDSAMRLWQAFEADGDLVDVDAALPARVARALWKAVEKKKAQAFRAKAGRLLHKLRDILAAETVVSAAGRAPDRLRASVGSSFAGAFDFEAMSNILIESKPGIELSDERRGRIHRLIEVIENQRFYPLGERKPYAFEFEHCSDALTAFNERQTEAVELLKTLAIAELEVGGDYREPVHDLLFDGYGANGLDAREVAGLPEYLICANGNTMNAEETAQIAELLAAGLPAKVLVQTDDLLETSSVVEAHVTLGLRARQLVNTAIGLTDVFVLQTSASQLFQKRESFLRGLTCDGAALFNVFSGANKHTGFSPYLVAAAAAESRLFPTLVYDPSNGSDWASRLSLDGNPQASDDWTFHALCYEDRDLQAHTEKLAFTIADFMAMDERFFRHYAVVPVEDWSDSMIPVTEFLKSEDGGMSDKVPYITLVDDENCLHRAILDHRLMLETRRCLTMWRSLRQLGGAQKTETGKTDEPENANENVPVSETAVEVVAEQIIKETGGDEPYIETSRCTSCNECTRINSKMFAYNENKQAYLADADAGTFRQLVEAAESCQVGIIHPGKPKNPKEPGLDDLLKRAAGFN